MMVLLKERSKVLAEEMGWSLDRAAGYLEGEKYRNSGQELSPYLKVGIDEYARGFRAGYYKREEQLAPSSVRDIASARQA